MEMKVMMRTAAAEIEQVTWKFCGGFASAEFLMGGYL